MSETTLLPPSDFLAQVRFDLAMSDKSDRALSRILRIKKELGSLDQTNPLVVRLSSMLKDVPPGVDCECCGFKGLVNIERVNGHIVGPECAGHEFGNCKGKRKTHTVGEPR